MMTSIRSLVRLLAQEGLKPRLKWQFHPDRVIDGDYNKAWTGVEEIYGTLFDLVLSSPRTTGAGRAAVDYQASISDDIDSPAAIVKGFVDVTDDPMGVLRDLGREVRAQIEQKFNDEAGQLRSVMLPREEIKRGFPQWRAGIWSIPEFADPESVQDYPMRFKGWMIDFDLFKIYVPNDQNRVGHYVLVAREQFRQSNPKQSWLVTFNSSKIGLNDVGNYVADAIHSSSLQFSTAAPSLDQLNHEELNNLWEQISQ